MWESEAKGSVCSLPKVGKGGRGERERFFFFFENFLFLELI